ncbi:methyl-accepting chemotaxis protein [Shewanella sp. C32]|uniref:Methyl-accepting chemotaxis protein n=1 Tax=Shewanella electrica TaxID=515560 RepID=A0ABT2FFL0_9GAMM|nr:methyl-accepting chemotaxis protein [Shewanella electrica]MCH1925199.1 methyl-accepting chemotaxis protein [Shewanella electrica]MCS4555024.1 methyl-accepting chemotaxis protein [Shewanella electrica]
MIGAILFSAIQLQQVISNRHVIEQVKPLVQLSIIGGKIVHELQKERGITAGFVGSSGHSFADKLPQQRRLTDSVLAQQQAPLKVLLAELAESQPEVHRQISAIQTELAKLPQFRAKVDTFTVPVKEAAAFYTQLNAQWLALNATIAKLSTFNQLTADLRNYATFMQAKEYAGLERAILSVVFSKDQFQADQYYNFVHLFTLQTAYLQSFEQFASAEQVTALKQIDQNSVIKQVDHYRNIANQSYINGKFGISSTDWFTASTARIDLLKQLEDQIATQISAQVQQLSHDAQQRLMLTIATTLVLTLVTIVLTISVSKTLINQTQALAQTMDQVSQSRDLSLRVTVQSQDELGRGAASFNTLLQVLSNMLNEITSSSVQLVTAAEQTSAAIKENSRQLDRQSHETEYAATATEQMNATVHEIAHSTTLTADAASKAAALSSAGVVEVQSSTQRMQQLNEQMSWANTVVQQLRDSSSAINEIVDVIKVVAEQTNLLALNAAIEAARAGEHGRGFAVVADEVRTLAQRTQDSTQQIDALVSRFQTDASSVSSAIEASFEHVKACTSQTQSVQAKLGDINSAIEQITDMCTQIATAAEQQVATTNEIAQNIRTINDIAVSSASMGAQIATAAQQQTVLATEQQTLVNRFTLA